MFCHISNEALRIHIYGLRIHIYGLIVHIYGLRIHIYCLRIHVYGLKIVYQDVFFFRFGDSFKNNEVARGVTFFDQVQLWFWRGKFDYHS